MRSTLVMLKRMKLPTRPLLRTMIHVDGNVSITSNICKLIGRKIDIFTKANSLPSHSHSQNADYFVDATDEEGVNPNFIEVDRDSKRIQKGKN